MAGEKLKLSQEELNGVLENHQKWWASKLYEGNQAILHEYDLSGMDLSGKNLRWADFRNSDLRKANFKGADLRDAYFAFADLSEADLTDANLGEAKLWKSNLANAILPAGIPVVPDLDQKILDTIRTPGKALDMSAFHKDENTHCRGVWAIVLAGEEGKALEKKWGTMVAAILIYQASTNRIPDFCANYEDTIKDMEEHSLKREKGSQ